MLGYCGCGSNPPIAGDDFGVYRGNFLHNILNVTDIGNKAVNLDSNNTSISDSSGNLLFFTNGERVYNKNYSTMDNGAELITNGDGYGCVFSQGSLIIPKPGSNHIYFLFQIEYKSTGSGVIGTSLFRNTIDMSFNNGLGKVIEKRHLLINDTLAIAELNAVKHANGRDWWVVVPRDESDRYHVLYISDQDTTQIHESITGQTVLDGLGQTVFSPDGNTYIRGTDRSFIEPYKIDIYDFDRCAGMLSNHRSGAFDSVGFGVGVAVSPNSRYLYVSHTQFLFQYDLTAPDIFASEILVATHDESVSGNYPTYLFYAQSAPDGRIYINSRGSSFRMHVLNHPNRSIDSCDFVQDGIELAYFNATVPTFPNYRLGPVDGSSCDTLGIDNHPLCNWRWEQEDTLHPLRITFTDLSAYQPSKWFWTFGDGASSYEQYPFHTYIHEGIFTVCLIVSNEFSRDTFCQVINLTTSGTSSSPSLLESIAVRPNPFGSLLYFDMGAGLPETVITLYDITGRVALRQKAYSGLNEINTTNLPSGMYFWQIVSHGVVVKQGKLVKVE